MSSTSIVLDTRFLAQDEDTGRWEDRFDLIVSELREEYGQSFEWSFSGRFSDADIVFILYPPVHHQRVVADRLLEGYILPHAGERARIHVIVIGRNSKDAKVRTADVVDLINTQCIPSGIKADADRALRPEELDDAVRSTLVRLFTRRQGASSRLTDELPAAEGTGVSNPNYSSRPLYESGDL